MTSKCDYLAHDSVAPPIGLLRLKHNLKLHGFECDIYDLQLHSDREVIARVENGDYDIIGVSVTHWNIINDLNFHWTLRDAATRGGRKCLFIAGGNPATQASETWLQAGFDLILIGFAEESLLALCRRMEAMPGAEVEVLAREIAGSAYLDKSGAMVRKPSPFMTVEDLQRLCFTQDMEMDNPYPEYWAHVARRASTVLNMNNRSYVVENARLYTSSHCAATCGFCDSPTFIAAAQGIKAAVHALTPRQVRELVAHHCREFGARAFSFNDDNFLLGNKIGVDRIIEVCREIVEAKRKGEIPGNVKFSCQARGWDYLVFHKDGSRTPNYELMRGLAEAGFHNLSIGVETFSDRLMKMPSINKGTVRREHYHTALHAMMDHGLFPTINLILGIPESTAEELLETVDEAMVYLDRPCQLSIAYRMFSFPGTAIWNRPDYPTSHREWKHPVTGRILRIPYYFIPRDPRIAALMDTLEDDARAELARMKADMNWDDDRLMPRVTHALCAFTVITRNLGATELGKRIRKRMDEMIAEIGAGACVPTSGQSIC